MQDILFIGDEVTAAGFRMAGVEARVVAGPESTAIVAEELKRRRVIVMTMGVGKALPGPMFERLLQSVEPLVALVPDGAGRFEERDAPATLASGEVTLIDVYGSLYYAGARTLQARLPDPAGAERPAVVLRLRGRAMLGATAYVVLSDYARRLDEVGGRLYLSGVASEVVEQLHRNATVEQAGEVRIFPATATVGESSLDAYAAAQEWLSRRS